MNKYVNIEELKKRVNEEFCLEFTKSILNNTIDEMSSADVVEVVRCKDCKHRNEYFICSRLLWRETVCVEDDFFCKYGERKETE